MDLTQKKIKDVFSYNPETGGLIRQKVGNRKYNSLLGMPVSSKHVKGYLIAGVCGKRHLVHRLIWMYMTGKWPEQIDHINGNKADNRWANLRDVNNIGNSRNSKVYSTNTSGATGVYWDKKREVWEAKICVNYKNIHISYHGDWFDAVCARKSAERTYGFHPNHGRPQ